MTAPGTVVIVGAGHAGVQAAFSLREEGYDGDIQLLTRERWMPYERPPLSKAWLKAGDHHVDDLYFRSPESYADKKIDLIRGVTVERIDRTSATLECSDGLSRRYDHLVLAPGAVPRRLTLPGSDLVGVCHLHTIDDAQQFLQRIDGARSVVVIGGGFIGLEVAAAARARGLDVVVLEAGTRLMQRAVTSQTSTFFDRVHRVHGTDVRYGAQVEALGGDDAGRVGAVHLAGGEVLAADVVVVGVGARPATELAEEAGLRVDDGIVVDELLTTSDPQISAVGDCARFPLDHQSMRLESVQNAVDHGRCVAGRLAGRPQPYREVPWFWTEQHGCKLQIAGLLAGYDANLVLGDVEARKFTNLCWKDGVFVGAESINRPGDHIAVRRLLSMTPDHRPSIETATAEGFELKEFARSAQRAADLREVTA